MPRISVIIAAFNAEQHITDCIKSIESQSIINDIEIIVVNDGSTDSTSSIVSNYTPKYNNIKFIDRKENLGTIYSRKEGFDHSSGNYIYFMDADDKLMPLAMENLLKTITQNNCDIAIMGGYLWLPLIKWKINYYIPSLRITDIPNHNQIKQYLINSLYGINPLCNNLWNKLFRRDIITFNDTPKIFLGDDAIISLPIYMNCHSFAYTDYMGILWRAGGSSTNWQSQKWDDYKDLYRYMENQLFLLYDKEIDISNVKKIHAENAITNFIENISQRITFKPLRKKRTIEYIEQELSTPFWNEIRDQLSTELTPLLEPHNMLNAAKKHIRKHWIYNYIIRPIASLHK